MVNPFDTLVGQDVPNKSLGIAFGAMLSNHDWIRHVPQSEGPSQRGQHFIRENGFESEAFLGVADYVFGQFSETENGILGSEVLNGCFIIDDPQTGRDVRGTTSLALRIAGSVVVSLTWLRSTKALRATSMRTSDFDGGEYAGSQDYKENNLKGSHELKLQ